MCRTTEPFTQTHHNLKLERCKFKLPNNSFSISETLDGHVAFSDEVNDKKTKPVALVRNNNKHRICNKLKLEDIPEDKELRVDTDGDVYENPEVEEALEMDLEVMRRAFDMGIWVVCLGLGYMFSRTKFRPPTFS